MLGNEPSRWCCLPAPSDWAGVSRKSFRRGRSGRRPIPPRTGSREFSIGRARTIVGHMWSAVSSPAARRVRTQPAAGLQFDGGVVDADRAAQHVRIGRKNNADSFSSTTRQRRRDVAACSSTSPRPSSACLARRAISIRARLGDTAALIGCVRRLFPPSLGSFRSLGQSSADLCACTGTR